MAALPMFVLSWGQREEVPTNFFPLTNFFCWRIGLRDEQTGRKKSYHSQGKYCPSHVHTHTHTRTTDMPTHTETTNVISLHSYTNTHAIYLQAHLHSCSELIAVYYWLRRLSMPTHKHTCAHARMHACTHTHTDTCAHTHTHTQTYLTCRQTQMIPNLLARYLNHYTG